MGNEITTKTSIETLVIVYAPKYISIMHQMIDRLTDDPTEQWNSNEKGRPVYSCILEEEYYKIHPNKNVIESFFAVLHPTWVALS